MTEPKPKRITGEATINRHKNEIDEAAKRAAKLIIETAATSASAAAKLISDAAAIAVDVVKTKDGGDHDLLIKLNTLMEGLKEDIKDLKSGTSLNIEDHERRIGGLESKISNNKIYMALYTLLILGLASLVITHLFNSPIIR